VPSADAPIDTIVEQVVAAHRAHEPIPAIHTVADLDDRTAYTIQHRVFESRFGSVDGATGGYKIGLANVPDQKVFGTDQPIYGRLAPTELVASPARLTLDRMFRPIIEPEVVFHFDDDLSPAASFEEIIEKSRVAAGLELPDSRYVGWPNELAPVTTDLIVDNACVGLVISADATTRAAEIDLPNMVCTMRVDGEVLGTGKGSDVSGDPARMVVWLSGALAEQGVVLRKGDRVSSGAVVAPSPLKILEPGRYTADFAGIGVASLEVV
jgi:2-keto-4-pentenoate hydratase